MTATVLYRIDPPKRMHRFYRPAVQPDLFGRWCLMRESGRSSMCGPGALDLLPTRQQSRDALDKAAAPEGERLASIADNGELGEQ